MRGRAALLLTLLASACGSTPPVAEPSALPFARMTIEAAAARAAPVPGSAAPSAPGRPAPALPPFDEAAAVGGIVSVPTERMAVLREAASDESALGRFLEAPIGRDDLGALAYLRSPRVRAARARLVAARTGFRQADDLSDLVATYRSFLVETRTGVGPERSRRPASRIAPSPNLDGLSAEVVARGVAIEEERLRAAVRDVVADAERVQADAARLSETRRILTESLALEESLLAVLKARLESGGASQAGYLSFSARVSGLRAEIDVLASDEAAVRARLNGLLSRPADAAVNLGLAFAPPGAAPDADGITARALARNPEHRVSVLAAERAEIAVRVAETMTLPRFDLGSSRYEREAAGEAGVARGMVFREGGRPMPVPSEFGVREAQVTEMRARREALAAARDASRDRTAAGAHRALSAYRAAARRLAADETEVVPLRDRAYESARGAYEGNRADYLVLLDAARARLAAWLGLAGARRDLAHARAALLVAMGVHTQQGR